MLLCRVLTADWLFNVTTPVVGFELTILPLFVYIAYQRFERRSQLGFVIQQHDVPVVQSLDEEQVEPLAQGVVLQVALVTVGTSAA